MVEQNFPNPKALDEWVPHQDYTGRRSFVRAFPPRLVHVLPGNSPGVAVESIAQGAMVKAVNLFKMSSSDPFTTVAILRTMADIDPNHAIVKSMSAVYWRGGDDAVERMLYRPQYFDKIVAWGGGDAINNVIKYLGPGFQLVSFDPKTSISMVGKEAFASEETLRCRGGSRERRRHGAQPGSVRRQSIHLCRGRSRRGRPLLREIAQAHLRDAPPHPASARPLDMELREQIETMMMMDDDYRVWGRPTGAVASSARTSRWSFTPSTRPRTSSGALAR